MNREFLINISLLLGLNFIIKPFYIFGIEREVQNIVGTEMYGEYITLFTFTFLLQIINDFGLQNFNNRAISRRPQRLYNYFSNILVLKIFLGLAFILVSFVAAYLWGYQSKNLWHIFFFFCLNHILISLNLYLRSNISGIGLYRTDSIISALDKTLLIGICALLLWGNISTQPFQIEWFVYAQTCSLFLTAVTAFIIVSKQIKQFSFNLNLRFMRSVLRSSFPYALVIFLMTIYTRIDIIMIEKMLPDGDNQAGIYAAAFRLLDACNMIGFLFAGILMPMFSKLLADLKNTRIELQSLVEMSFQIVWSGVLTLAISVFFFREEIMFYLYDAATPYWGEILGWLILSFIAMSGTYIFGTLLTANGSMKKMNLLFVASIVINIVLNTLLISSHQAAGAAMATFVTQFFALILQIYLSKTELNIQLSWRIFGKIITFVSALILINFSLQQSTLIAWEYLFLSCLVGGIILSFLFRLINLKLLFGMMKSKV
ncbi:MAG: O-antigen/teichoic acid export membrane protein [Saprospiraceae bacterium]|jgi:O-antigen/teichoic acid export membrane protein